jgi:zinc transporter ZupT
MKCNMVIALVGFGVGIITFISGTTMIPTGSNEGTQQTKSAEEYMNQQNAIALGSYGFRFTMAGVAILLISLAYMLRIVYIENRENESSIVVPLPAAVPAAMPVATSVPVAVPVKSDVQKIEVVVDNRPRVMTSPAFGALGPLDTGPPSSHSSSISPQLVPMTRPLTPFRPLKI